MSDSLAVLFALLIAVPGVLIPLHVLSRMLRVLTDRERHATDRIFAGGTMIAMLLLMGIAVYAAGETSRILNALADQAR